MQAAVDEIAGQIHDERPVDAVGTDEGDAVPVQDLRAGDLVFFRIGKAGSMHVGIATGQGSFIHSPKPGQRVREENLYAPYWTQRKIAVRRIL